MHSWCVHVILEYETASDSYQVCGNSYLFASLMASCTLCLHIHAWKGIVMAKYICDVCGYIYDPEVGDPDGGIAPGTAFEDIPEDWVCPVCGVGKEDFSLYEE